MPIIRSIIDLGNSKTVTIPKSWITNAEEKTGRKIIALALEIDGFITLTPVFEKASPDLALQQTRPAIKI